MASQNEQTLGIFLAIVFINVFKPYLERLYLYIKKRFKHEENEYTNDL